NFSLYFFFLISPPPPRSTLFPYTTLFRSLTVPKLCQILLLNRSCARFQRHLVGLTVHFLQGLSLHLQFHLRILFEDLCVALSKRSEEHTSELQSRGHLVCRLLLEKKKKTI